MTNEVIDRLTGKLIGADQSLTQKWSLDSVRETALAMGKQFVPSPDIESQLDSDLKLGALVFFTAEEVEDAVSDQLIPREWKTDLIDLVDPEGKNDIAVIPTELLAQWKRQQLFLTSR